MLNPASFRFPPNWDYWLQIVTQTLFEQGVQNSAPMFFDAAVRDATLHLEERLRKLSDAPVTTIGTELVDFTFHPETGFLADLRAPSPERQGLYLLFKGVVLSLRNPVGHRKTNLDPRAAYDAIALVDYLLDAANRAALERLVFPFLTRQDIARTLISVHRVDLNSNNSQEVIVLVVESQGSEHRTRVLVLRGDPLEPVPGDLPTIPGGVNQTINGAFDFDDDGVCEVFISATTTPDQHAALLVDFDGDSVWEVARADGLPLSSRAPGFQVVRPARLRGRPAIASFNRPGEPEFWVYRDGALTRAD